MAPPPSPQGQAPEPRAALVALGQLALAVALLSVFSAQYETMSLEGWLLDTSFAAWPGAGEAQLFLLLLGCAVPASLLMGAALATLVPGPLERAARGLLARPRWLVGGAAAGAVVLALLARRFVTQGADFTDDERLYWYQAQLLLEGGFTGPIPQPARAFFYEFVVSTRDGLAQTGIFTVGQPLLFALASKLGDRGLFQWLLVGPIVLLTWRLALLVFDDRRAALAAAVLVALSPWLLGVAASGHNSLPTAFFSTLALVAALEHAARPRFGWALTAGAAIGATFLVRPLDGPVVGVAVALSWARCLWLARGPARTAWLKTIAAGLGATLLVASVQAAANRTITGSPFTPVYSLWNERDWPGAVLFGLGKGSWQESQTILSMTTKTMMTGFRISLWSTGSLVLFTLVVLALLVPAVRRAAWFPLTYGGLLVSAYALFVFPSTNDFGTVYHLGLLPVLAALSGAALVWLRARLGLARVAAHFAAALLVAVLTFWTVEAGRLSLTSQRIRQPIELARRAAEEHGPVLVLWRTMQGKRTHWVFKPPPASPTLSEPVLWASDLEELIGELAQRYPHRKLVRLVWKAEFECVLEPVPLP